MATKIGVLLLWFMFAIWGYISIIYALGIIWFARAKAKNSYYQKSLIAINLFIFCLNTIGQVFTIVLFVLPGGGQEILSALKNKSDTAFTPTQTINTYYLILFIVNIIVGILQLTVFLFCSNNLVIKFSQERLLIMGTAVIYSAIVKLSRSKRGHLVLEYVYKQENKEIFTEKLRFFKWFSSTRFLQKESRNYFDPQRNMAFFKLDQVTQKPTSEKKMSSQKIANEKKISSTEKKTVSSKIKKKPASPPPSKK